MKTEIQQVLTATKLPSRLPFTPVHPPYIDLFHRNQEVRKIYNSMVTDLRKILSKLTSTNHRTYMMFSYPKMHGTSYVMFEFISVLCSFRLCMKEYVFMLEFDTHTEIANVVGERNYAMMMRDVYRSTNYECTQYNLEDCITINTALYDHYTYFKMRVKDDSDPDALIAIEDAIFE